MTGKRVSYPIIGCLVLLFVSNCLAASRPTVLDDILDTLKDIEDLVRGSSDTLIYLTSAIGRNGIFHSPQLVRSRDVVMNVEPFEGDNLRDFLNSESRGSRSASSNPNGNGNGNQMQRLSDDDVRPMRPFPGPLPKMRRKPRIHERPFSDDENSNANSNVNSNSNSNINSNAMKHANSGLKIKSGRNPYGARSLSRSRFKDINRNVNTNVNTNTMDTFDDDEFDDDN